MSESHPLRPILCAYVTNCLQALQIESGQMLKNSAFHVEVFYDERRQEPVFCEAASRVSGCRVSDNWTRALGLNLLDEHTVGQVQSQPPSLTQPMRPHRIVGSIYIPVRVGFIRNLPETCPIDGIVDYTSYFKAGDMVREAVDGAGFKKRLVFAFVEGPNEESVLITLDRFRKWFYSTHVVDPLTVPHE